MNNTNKPRKSELYVIARRIGTNSIEITIPINVTNLMEIKEGDRLEVDFGDKKYGKRLSIWNYKQQMKEYRRRKK